MTANLFALLGAWSCGCLFGVLVIIWLSFLVAAGRDAERETK